MRASQWAFLVYTGISILLCGLILLGSWFLGEKTSNRNKILPFESGINSVGSARLRFSVKFYLLAMFFVIFDVEALYLYAWAISVRESGWLGLTEAAIFIFVLISGLIYLARLKAL